MAEISTDKSCLDVTFIHHFLCDESYWAANIPLELVRTSIENSLCFGAYEGGGQVGFARVITDYATFGYVADVFVAPSHRGAGVGRELMAAIVRASRAAAPATLAPGHARRAPAVREVRLRAAARARAAHGDRGRESIRNDLNIDPYRQQP